MMDFGANQFRSIAGVCLIVALCWALSENRRDFPWRLTLGAIALQVIMLLLLFGTPWARAALNGVADAVDGATSATQAGVQFVFGYLGGGPAPFDVARPEASFVFAFQVLPLILVISALSALLWHWGILRWLIRGFGLVFERVLGIGGASSFAAAANIFLGMIEAPILIRGYLARLTRPEMFLMIVVGLATVAGSTMVAYAALLMPVLPHAAGHVLAASILSAPAAIALARIMMPERRDEAAVSYDSDLRYEGSLDAITRGTQDGLQIVLNVAATLLVFVALAALANSMLGLLPPIGGAPISIQRMLGILLTPLAWIMGVSWEDAPRAAQLLGVKAVLTEFVAYIDLSKTADLSPRSTMILTYALCGFANFGSVGITISGLTMLMPDRRSEILELSWKAFVPGFLATCMSGAIVGAMPEVLFQFSAIIA